MESRLSSFLICSRLRPVRSSLPLPQVEIRRIGHITYAALRRQSLPLSPAHLDCWCRSHVLYGPLRQTHRNQDVSKSQVKKLVAMAKRL